MGYIYFLRTHAPQNRHQYSEGNMNTDEKIINWIEAGKQVGGRGKLDTENDVLWLSIAIQKHEEKYKTYSSEIYDSKITMEEYLKEESKNFFTPQEALDHLRSESKLEVSELGRRCKNSQPSSPLAH
ncbi:hypothetical protein BK661_20985 [Pseudomonas frederiksbergensis]|jgi:hypothetical protein|uniref:Uncharacterized protein n=2 Tax=Pseudomonas TaxID=286 RepID=A0A423IWL5_9PSED|nr:hypothetical protein BK661_20985 [Pseudomonas frederiksbergensis]